MDFKELVNENKFTLVVSLPVLLPVSLFLYDGEAIANLPERERLVLALYYDEELNLKEIGEVLGVSESRVSQLHSQCAARLRSRLGEWRAR